MQLLNDRWLQQVQCREDIEVNVCSGDKVNSVTLKWLPVLKKFLSLVFHCFSEQPSSFISSLISVALCISLVLPCIIKETHVRPDDKRKRKQQQRRKDDQADGVIVPQSFAQFLQHFLFFSSFPSSFLIPSFSYLILLVPVIIPQLRHFTAADDWQVVEVAGMLCQAD